MYRSIRTCEIPVIIIDNTIIVNVNEFKVTNLCTRLYQ